MDNAFKVVSNGQTYDYRISENLNLDEVKAFFEKDFAVSDLKQTGRHVTGVLNDGTRDSFIKLSTTKGVSLLNQNEFKWNEEFNKEGESPEFRVPKNVSSGEYNGLFYFLAEKLDGEILSSIPGFELDDSFQNLIPKLLDFADYVMSKEVLGVGKPDIVTGNTPQEWFVNKTKAWFEATPEAIRIENNVGSLLEIVTSGASGLVTKPRHGDYTPWHIMKLRTGGLGLLDGEHAMSEGVELYDIAYLIQRVHTISNRPDVATKIFEEAKSRGFEVGKLKTVLASRGIGGFLDAHLANKTDLSNENNFSDWVISP
jgi:hypothetical protein